MQELNVSAEDAFTSYIEATDKITGISGTGNNDHTAGTAAAAAT